MDRVFVEKVRKIPHSFKFGDKVIYPNVFLSPMSGVTDYPFRRLIVELAARRTGMFVSEFVSVDGMTRLIPKVCRHMYFDSLQRPFAVQIFGGNPDSLEKGAVMVEQSGAEFIEINCGCPAPRVVRRSGGSGLLKDLGLFKAVIQRVVRAVNIPVSVKVRTGFSKSDINVLETSKIAEGEGAGLFIIHGRTREQGYKGLADWDLIGRVKEQSGIPVIGNGDILRVEDIIMKLEKYGVDGVSVGRGAMHNPWIFRQIADLFEGKEPLEPSLKEQEQVFYTYRDFLSEEFQVPGVVLGRLKQICARIIKCMPHSAKWRAGMLRSASQEEFFDLLGQFYEGRAAHSRRVLDEIGDLNGREGNKIEYT
ncbi:tRNA dihydrouridine synthase [Fibrobacterota bacterium]